MSDGKKIDIGDLIGAKFRNHGRSRDTGFDCYGLAIEVSRRFGHELPDLWYERSTDDVFTANAEKVIESLSGKVGRTDRQAAGNIVLFSDRNGNMVHIGVFLEENMFIHADESGVHVSRLSTYFRRDWRIYRWLP